MLKRESLAPLPRPSVQPEGPALPRTFDPSPASMGNAFRAGCCAQGTPMSSVWEKTERREDKNEALTASTVVDLTIYAYEPSLSMSIGDSTSQQAETGDISEFGSNERNAAPVPSAIGVTDRDGGLSEDSEDDFLSLPASESAPRPHHPPTSSSHQHPLMVHQSPNLRVRFMELELEDYLCTCLYCPRAVAIQRAYQLYGFALDHPQSESLLRVLRACANYDETVVEIDPLLVLHAEKLLEELQLPETQAFRLLVASHFRHT